MKSNDAQDETILQAVKEGALETLRALIDAGADVNAATRTGRFSGMTPLRAARENRRTRGHAECIRLLLAAGAEE